MNDDELQDGTPDIDAIADLDVDADEAETIQGGLNPQPLPPLDGGDGIHKELP